MVSVKDFYDFLDAEIPFDTQESWDNSGLLVGDMQQEVQTAAVVLDLNRQTLRQAAALHADLIIAHHPVLFKPQKSFLKGDLAYELAVNQISFIASHTCFDCAGGGVNDVLAELLELERVEVLETEEGGAPLLRVGFIKPTTPNAFAEFAGNQLCANVRFASGGKAVETVAVCSGSGGGFVHQVAQAGIDALVTGDADHHDFLDAADKGITLVAAGHFETENPAIPVLAQKLRNHFETVDIIVLTEENPVQYIWKE